MFKLTISNVLSIIFIGISLISWEFKFYHFC